MPHRTTLVERLYRALLFCYPAEFRREYGTEMTRLFRDRHREHGGRLRLWLQTFVDIAVEAPREHVDILLGDLRHTFRLLRRSPGFTLTVILTLALAIGANTAIFAILDAVLLRPLAVRAPHELALIDRVTDQSRDSRFSCPLYEDLRDDTEAFQGVIAVDSDSLVLGDGAERERVRAALVSENYFNVLGVGPWAGRVIVPGDARTQVVVLSYGFWRRRFGGDPTIVGKTVNLNSRTFTVIGIGESSFTGTEAGLPPDLFLPVSIRGEIVPGRDLFHDPRSNWVEIIARRRSGVSLLQAQSSANAVFQHTLQNDAREQRLELLPGARGRSQFRTFASTPLLALSMMAGFVLMIACANVANLLLARAAGRRREIAMRLALGSGRTRLVRQFLTEAMVLALFGGALGTLLAYWTSQALPQTHAQSGQPLSLDLHLDLRNMAFFAAITMLSGALCALAPAIQATRNVTARTRLHRFSLTRMLVAVQVALSVLLLIGAGLFARSLEKLHAIDLGFVPDHVLMSGVGPIRSESRQLKEIYPQLMERLGAIPGVRSVSIASQALLSGAGSGVPVSVEAYRPKSAEDLTVNDIAITPGYFATLGLPLLLGRDFTTHDTRTSPRVAIVNETTARYFFGGQNPIGRRFAFGANQPPDIQIVGVVKDSKYRILREPSWRSVYIPSSQSTGAGMTIVMLRTAGDPLKIAPALRSRIQAVDPNLFIWVMRTLPQQIDINTFSDTVLAKVAGFFGLLALIVASVGLYGVISHAVTRRTHEIGIRMALGARRGRVLWLLTKEALMLLAGGIAIGIPAALLLARLISSLFYNVEPGDPLVTLAAITLLLAVAFLATWIPARRATNIDPMEALRHDVGQDGVLQRGY